MNLLQVVNVDTGRAPKVPGLLYWRSEDFIWTGFSLTPTPVLDASAQFKYRKFKGI